MKAMLLACCWAWLLLALFCRSSLFGGWLARVGRRAFGCAVGEKDVSNTKHLLNPDRVTSNTQIRKAN